MSRLWLVMLALALWACSDSDVPEPYRDIAVPEHRLVNAAAQGRGRALFVQHCALCHGVRADGRGVRRSALSQPPASFVDPSWRAQAGPRRVFATIRLGVHGTSMPAWPMLTDDQTWDLVAYLLHAAGATP